MRCNKCGSEIPDEERFCPICGHKLQSDRLSGGEAPEGQDGTPGPGGDRPSRLLDFQGWSRPERGIGPYVEACAYAVILAAGVAACLAAGVYWPLYPLLAVLGLVAWRRRLLGRRPAAYSPRGSMPQMVRAYSMTARSLEK